jgi:hypothetical protein
MLASPALAFVVLLATTGAPAADDPAERDYQQGYAAYQANRLDEAERQMRRIMATYPKHERSIYAENIVLDILSREKRTKEFRALLAEIESKSRWGNWDAEFFDSIAEAKAKSYDLDAHEDEAKRDFRGCGLAYFNASLASPNLKRRRERMSWSAACYDAGGFVGPGLHARVNLLMMAPSGPMLADALYLTGRGYYRLAHVSKAAEYYEKFAATFPRDKRAAAALESAFEIHVALTPDLR